MKLFAEYASEKTRSRILEDNEIEAVSGGTGWTFNQDMTFHDRPTGEPLGTPTVDDTQFDNV